MSRPMHSFPFFLLAFLSCLTQDPEAAFRASVLFCFNPASIIYSSIYSESLYALFSVGGLYYLISGAKNIAVLWLALSGCARSNGVRNAGYFCFQTMHQAYDALFLKKRVGNPGSYRWSIKMYTYFIPFIAFQVYGYHNLYLGALMCMATTLINLPVTLCNVNCSRQKAVASNHIYLFIRSHDGKIDCHVQIFIPYV
ncbi:hypothetical protein LWI29_033674 [Acer saccharum]|uniref:GPI mannosyltransferase 2 n=1 Tax=Acer saccharum TaxID=4024 RepID=A0AA39RUT7_ACESA|nr:hypothetical protein LWI29_033674 [Acer saccharum]